MATLRAGNSLACHGMIGQQHTSSAGAKTTLRCDAFPLRAVQARQGTSTRPTGAPFSRSSARYFNMMLSRGLRAAARSKNRLTHSQPRRFDSHSTGHRESAFNLPAGSDNESLGVCERDISEDHIMINSIAERLLYCPDTGSPVNGRLRFRILFRQPRPHPIH